MFSTAHRATGELVGVIIFYIYDIIYLPFGRVSL